MFGEGVSIGYRVSCYVHVHFRRVTHYARAALTKTTFGVTLLYVYTWKFQGTPAQLDQIITVEC